MQSPAFTAAIGGAVQCPRCGYNLRGITDGWRDSCDVRGVCSECGLAFEWGSLLDPRRSVPSWFVENWEPLGFSSMVQTLARSCVPWHFWREVKIWYGVRPGRALALLGAVLLVSLVVASSGLAAETYLA